MSQETPQSQDWTVGHPQREATTARNLNTHILSYRAQVSWEGTHPHVLHQLCP